MGLGWGRLGITAIYLYTFFLSNYPCVVTTSTTVVTTSKAIIFRSHNSSGKLKIKFLNAKKNVPIFSKNTVGAASWVNGINRLMDSN